MKKSKQQKHVVREKVSILGNQPQGNLSEQAPPFGKTKPSFPTKQERGNNFVKIFVKIILETLPV